MTQWAHQHFKVGPDYCPPAAPISDAWIDADDPDVVSEATDYGYWWAVFNDPVLNELQETARRQNLPLRAAGARIVEARARLAIARGSLFPQLQEAFGEYRRTQVSQTTVNRLPTVAFDTWDAGFDASWELDIWGRFRRNIESAEATLDAQVDDRDDVLVILQGEVAAAYIQMRAFQKRLRLAENNVALQEKTLELADIRFRRGAVTELDPAQAKENLASTQALIPPLQTGIRQTQNALCILLGTPPHDLNEMLGPGPIPESPPEAIVGIPADLLRRRPDVRRAERLAAAQSAQIGIAESDLYPRFAITGFVGYQASDLSDLFQTNSFNGSVGPGFQWNILNYGRIRNNVRGEEARCCELVFNYQNTVLEANREVEDAIDA
ncbi:MAG TPA: efflux transporter outer membrane subunit, partial [Thermoguttaceae bacterium]|nr:efflux transporter outer membrane subunit [Thermoguttaceae bacterium]